MKLRRSEERWVVTTKTTSPEDANHVSSSFASQRIREIMDVNEGLSTFYFLRMPDTGRGRTLVIGRQALARYYSESTLPMKSTVPQLRSRST